MRRRTRGRSRPGALRLAYSGAVSTLRILQNVKSSELRFRARLSEGRTPRLEVTRAKGWDIGFASASFATQTRVRKIIRFVYAAMYLCSAALGVVVGLKESRLPGAARE